MAIDFVLERVIMSLYCSFLGSLLIKTWGFLTDEVIPYCKGSS